MPTRPACLDARNGPQTADATADGARMSTNEAMRLRGIRGATTVDANSREAILEATAELLTAIIDANGVRREDIASVFFSTTPDLNAEFPALAARDLGPHVALMCFHEMDVPGSLPLCIRVTMHVNTTRPAEEIRFVYLRDARKLRPDLFGETD